jgi:PAS domain S-box-containing protein
MGEQGDNHGLSDQIKNLTFDTLRKILDNSYDEIFVIDKNQNILYVNPVCQANYGLKQNEIIGKKAYELIQQGYCSPAVAPEVLEKKKQVTIEQETSVGKKFIVTATPVFNSDGEIELIVENSRDVTELEIIKQDLEDAQELVKRYKEEIQELRKSRVKSLGVIAHSKEMKRIFELAHHVAKSDSTILVYGDSGTGKGVLAKYIHKVSHRSEGPFITINCAAIPETLLESELFGYEKGAFTGAEKQGKLGLIELANEGTLFLDEIAEVPSHLQSKLLEVIEERRFIRVGGRAVIHVDVRIIASTNKNLKELAAKRQFREDLYYRLSVVEIEIPPLRARREDLMPLIYLFLNQYNKRYESHHVIAKETLEILMNYTWPGNVRELQHLMERLVVTVKEATIIPEHLPSGLLQTVEKQAIDIFNTPIPLDEAIERVTRELIIKAYNEFGSSYKVAEKLKISQSKANRLIRRFVVESKSSPK